LISSRRYALSIGKQDRYNRNKIFVAECRKYRTVLETGCSTGFLSRQIAEAGVRVTGIEVDLDAAEQARAACARVLTVSLNDSNWKASVGERFDLITFGDVLEHLNHPQTVLEDAKGLLNPGGRVLLCLPNIAHWSVRAKLMVGKFNYQSTGVLDVTHLRFFTLASARSMIQQAGYRELWFRPIFGGRFTNSLRSLWNVLAHVIPGAFAYQMMFLVEPQNSDETID